MLEINVRNSPIASTRKMRYVSTVINFHAAVSVGQTQAIDFDEILLQEANTYYLIRAVAWTTVFETTNKNYIPWEAYWWLGNAGVTLGDMMARRMVAAGAGRIAYAYNQILIPMGETDYSSPDGIGLSISQGPQLEIGYQVRLSGPAAAPFRVDSTLVIILGYQR